MQSTTQSSDTFNWQSLPRLVYTHNPFYLISALLVLIGLHQSLGSNQSLTDGWLLMEILCGYTTLLAIVGFIIVRFGKVWEDARTILLVILLLFVALSVSFDTRVLESPRQGARYLVAGLIFAVALSEGVFASLKIRLRMAYRLPYYLVLALLFLYPLALGQLSVDGHDEAMSWGVFLFPVVGAIALLSLWPAARTRVNQEPSSGTPWNWPWFPWSVFVILLLMMALRTYSLSMAFESFKGSAVSFQPYFLAPLVLVAAVLLLEAGIANRTQSVKEVALLLPVATLLVCLPGEHNNPVATRFLAMLQAAVGSPAQLALAGAATFYGIAALRGFRIAEIALVVCLVLASRVNAETVSLGTLAETQALPLAMIAVLELSLGVWRKTSWRIVVGTLAAIGAGSVLSDSLATPLHSTYVLAHATAFLVLFVGAIYNDRWARRFRWLMAPVVPLGALVAATMYEWFFPSIPIWYHALVVLGLCTIATVYWRRALNDTNLVAMLASDSALLAVAARFGYRWLSQSSLDKGMPWLAGGTIVLALALLMSLLKGGLLARGWQRLRAIGSARVD